MIPQTEIKQRAITGDALSVAIAAASVVAKCSRDAMMVEDDVSYPGYGFAKHKGYPTRQHYEALKVLGPSPIHRLSFCLEKRVPQKTLELFERQEIKF